MRFEPISIADARWPIRDQPVGLPLRTAGDTRRFGGSDIEVNGLR